MAACRITDVVSDKLTGPSQDFPDWIRTFRTGLEVTKTQPQEAVSLLKAFCKGACQDTAEDFITKYKENTPPPQRPANDARTKDYYSDMFEALVSHLGQSTAVVGSSPEQRFMTTWKGLKQLKGEAVQSYYQRAMKIVRSLEQQKKPINIGESEQLCTFVSGLSPEIKQQVIIAKPDNLATALDAAETAEVAFAPEPTPTLTEKKDDGNFSAELAELNRRLEFDHLMRQSELRSDSDRKSARRSLHSLRDSNYMRGGESNRGMMSRSMSVNNVYGPGSNGTSGGMMRPQAPMSRGAVHNCRGGPGCKPQICLNYFRNGGTCPFGANCNRLHITNMDQTTDDRSNVNVRITDEIRDQARAVIARYPNGPPLRNQFKRDPSREPTADMNADAKAKSQRVFVVDTKPNSLAVSSSGKMKAVCRFLSPVLAEGSLSLEWPTSERSFHRYRVHPVAGSPACARAVLMTPIETAVGTAPIWSVMLAMDDAKCSEVVAAAFENKIKKYEVAREAKAATTEDVAAAKSLIRLESDCALASVYDDAIAFNVIRILCEP